MTRTTFFRTAPETPPALPPMSRADLTAAYDEAARRYARDENPADLDEARRLGAALDPLN